MKIVRHYQAHILHLSKLSFATVIVHKMSIAYKSFISLWPWKSEKIMSTMLQKLSNSEVKAWLCWNLIILLSLWFYVKSNFSEFKRSKNDVFGNFRDSKLWIWVNLGLESCSNVLKSKLRTSKIAKKDIFGPFEIAKIWFHVKSEWQ